MRDLLNEPISSTLGEASGFVDAQAARLAKLRDRLAEEDLAIPALDRVAGELDALGERLATIDEDEIVDVVRGLASRRGPWLFAAAGAAVGVLAWAGLRKAGASEDQHDDAAAGEIEVSTGPGRADET
jgi:hypothetical protein